MPDNAEQLKFLIAQAESIAKEFNRDAAPNAKVAELAQIVADLADIVHSHLRRNDDPGQP